MKRTGDFITISPKDFIHGPYITCPKCGKNSFGVLTISGGGYCRRCAECYYPHGHEAAAFFPLPELDKKIIYLDQFAISNMMLLLHPKTESRRKKRVSPFWGELFGRIDSLCKLQLIICPDSDFHRTESSLAPFYDSLQRMYELLSHGVSFYDHETIRRFQISHQLEAWLGEQEIPPLNVHQIVHGSINIWQERFIISFNMPRNPDTANAIRQSREQVLEGMKEVFVQWREDKSMTFDDWYEEERNSWPRALAKSYHEFLANYALVSMGARPFQLDAILPNFAVITFHCIKDRLKEHGYEKRELDGKLIEFLQSREFKDAPFLRISAMLYAALARKVAAGRKKPPTKGFATDVEIVSTLLPYCDAMFIDNECAGYLAEEPLCNEIKYGTKIFSLNTKDEFLEYLDGIKTDAPKEHFDVVKEVYGVDWGKPFVELYRQD